MPHTTPLGTAVFPHLNSPDTKFDDNGIYATSLSLSPEDAEPLIAALEKMYDTEYKKFCQDKKKAALKQSDKPWSEEVDKDSGEPTGNYIFKFKMKAKTKTGVEMRPVLFDSKCQPLAENIGGGSKMKVAFEPSCWFVPALGVGISLRLKGVQVVELKEWGGRSAESLGFGEEEGFESASATLENAANLKNAHELIREAPEAETDNYDF
jgi:hypothetical protein